MRLTLRTLLAYLDDILEPSQTKEIGQKVAESGFASALVNRIREVMRRRRLGAPEVSGKGDALDANVVAEYLDNTLPPDAVADVEKVCLESDVHLAEVAACHQILALVLGEPVDVAADSRKRMYALGPGAATLDMAGDTEVDPFVGDTAVLNDKTPLPPTRRAEPAPEPVVKQPAEARIPDYLREKPMWQRVLPYAAVACVLLGWLGLVLSDHGPSVARFLGLSDAPAVAPTSQGAKPAADTRIARVDRDKPDGDNIAANDTTPPVTNPIVEAPTEPAAEPTTPEVATSIAPDTTTPEPAPVTVETPDNVVTVAPAAPVIPDAPIPDDPAPAPTNPAGDPTATVAPPDPGAEPLPPAEPVKPALPELPVQYMSADGALVRYDAEENDWFLLPHRSLVHTGEQIASPEPFVANFDIGPNHANVTILGGTSVQFLAPNDAAQFGLAIRTGKVVIRPGSQAGIAANAGLPVAIAVGSELWRVEFMEDAALCGIDITPRQPDQPNQNFGANSYTGTLYVLGGSVRFSDGARVRVISAGSQLPLTLGQREEAEAGTPLLDTPAWLTPEGQRLRPAARTYANNFEKQFQPNEPISLSIPNAAKDQRPRFAEFAVRCLALTENVPALVAALAQPIHEETRLAAIAGLRDWLPRAPENAEALTAELRRSFRDEDADVVLRLLWGYNETDARDQIASTQLVDWLGHDHIAVRELAFYNIKRLVKGRRTYDYRPNQSTQEREAAIKKWREHIQREGALVKSE